uniref:RING-type E3 ubiquitin transferase n=1 Tax=Phallusia mammillata TaxID=59560 RepID=A0A6F9DKI7_9ASCI|nr:E3 ubiquitin-protein ligase MARCH6 [Phallusia mammillata]
MTDEEEDICRVCRTTGSNDRPLFHPCICTGSIKHVHQDCLTQWLQHSRKEYCELCKHKYSFKPIYSPDMPSRLPIRDLFMGLARSIWSALKCWIHYTLVAVAWLGIVPLTACRIFKCIFSSSLKSLISFPMDMVSPKNVGGDVLNGFVIVGCSLMAFIGLVWLRMQILNGDMPEWIHQREILQDVNEDVIDDPGDDNQEDQELGDNVDDNNNEENAEPAQEPDVPEEPLGNWNGINWERAGDEPTWERILGLDGSLLFLEHVFWVVALNTLFILLFAFCPFHLGQFFLILSHMQHHVASTKMEGILTTCCGYFLIAAGFLVGHTGLKYLKLISAQRVCGLCYIVLKVCLLLVVELGILPLLSGFWLDVCSLKMFNSTLQDRKESYLTAPGSSLFFHWLSGFIFTFYVAFFLMMLKEILRPGTLWFVRRLNDPNFNPIRTMIHVSSFRHFQRLLATIIIFGTIIIVVAWLPVKFLQLVLPGFLPYRKGNQFASPIGDFPLQFMASQLILPIILEQGFWKLHLQNAMREWCDIVGNLLGIRSYLLIDDQLEEALHRHNPHHDENENVRPYTNKPKYFGLRVVILLLLVSGTMMLMAAVVLCIPVAFGRIYFQLLCGPDGPLPMLANKHQPVHEFYTFALGIWACWSSVRLVVLLTKYAPFGRTMITNIVKQCLVVVFKSLVVGVFAIGIVPLQFGLLFDLVIVIPLRVPLHQTPVIYLWQDWALGMLLQKLFLVCVFLGPNNWLRENIENAFDQGFVRLNLKKFLQDTLLKVVKFLLVCMTVPYVVGHGITFLMATSLTTAYFLHWRLYPCIIFGTSFFAFCWFEMKQFRRLCDHIKNERYLIGKRLVDYEPARAN